MLVNHPMSREAWRKLVESVKYLRSERYIPEYEEGHDPHVNKRYYR